MNNTRFALTLRQRDIYWDQLRHIGSPLYNVGGYIQFEEVDIPKLSAAHGRLISDTEVFGLRIVSTDEGAFQYVSSTRTSSLRFMDFSKERFPYDAATHWTSSLFNTALEFENGELFSAYCLKVASKEYRYVGLAHHIIMDGWGFSNWAKRLCQLYNDPLNPSPTDIPWQQIVAADEDYLASTRHISDEEYWGEQIQVRSNGGSLFRTKNYSRASSSNLGKRKTIEIPRGELDEIWRLAGSVGAEQLTILWLSSRCIVRTCPDRSN